MDSLLPQPLAQSNQQRPTLARTSQNHPPPSPAFLKCHPNSVARSGKKLPSKDATFAFRSRKWVRGTKTFSEKYGLALSPISLVLHTQRSSTLLTSLGQRA